MRDGVGAFLDIVRCVLRANEEVFVLLRVEVDSSFQKFLVEAEIPSRVTAEEISVIANFLHAGKV